MNLRRSTRLPAPASTAAPPATNSRLSCRPAAPPPPVCGAAVGYDGECELPGAYVNEVDGAGVAEPGAPDEREDAEALDDALADDALGEDDAPAPLRGPDAEADGVKIAGCADDDGVVQAATARAMQSVKVVAPTAVLAFLPAAQTVDARTFMKPPTNGLFRWPSGHGDTRRASDWHKA
ncbi:MAG TPA: hypothetical protein VF070_13765 [Streptosporangiaceae bacterium]